ncbi:hypothetical protein D5086_027014 [Populus alba]|uniref:Uncharacterized protein n=1 Tax=Populus alba TaxID=43335 RepID=A0ACC4B3I6_POPAL
MLIHHLLNHRTKTLDHGNNEKQDQMSIANKHPPPLSPFPFSYVLKARPATLPNHKYGIRRSAASTSKQVMDHESGEKKKKHQNKRLDLIEIYQKALDDLVNVNSLFTIAVFVGLSLAHPGEHSLEDRTECDADPDVAKRLVVFEVISFAFFLLSSLVAKTLKVHLNVGKLSCGSVYAFRAAGSLIAIVLLALGIYVPFMMHAIYFSMTHRE